MMGAVLCFVVQESVAEVGDFLPPIVGPEPTTLPGVDALTQALSGKPTALKIALAMCFLPDFLLDTGDARPVHNNLVGWLMC